ncbi:dicarboxylate/amino acid:cation symporter [Sphingomonas sp. 35-24ZXX]|uniref:dicarboxylate/amino acid:cation symporter n=1 Tax=Sphingomonas sp. 35-24ZXX TaxID=1545915 RepID=UPI00053BEE2D|nr:cation:dicarboxylase symporter family transporter [Sphingomonas sp. 35-24ZXX]
MLKTLLVLGALIIGISIGIALGNGAPGIVDAADVIGSLWLRGLQMTVVPLVVALLITGILRTAEMASAGRLTVRAIVTMIILLWASAAMATVVTPSLLGLFPLPESARLALQGALSSAQPTGEVPPFTEFLRALVPTNPIAAAANDAILPLIIFTLAFAFALTRLPAEKRMPVQGFFGATGDAMIILIGWVLALAPIGVFALGLVVGARAGGAAFGALGHYVLIVVSVGSVMWFTAFAIAAFAGRISPPAFLRASIPAQAVAISTQSSLASLPTMLTGVRSLGVGERTADVVLPIAVALFRATGPAMNMAVAVYVAHLMGIELGPVALAAGLAAAAITTMGSVSLPGSISFISAIAPICFAMGVPIEPLALLLAIEVFPDIMRTLGNVTMDMAVTTAIARAEGDTK